MADRHTEELRTFAHLAGLLAEEFPAELLDRRLRVVVADDALDTEAGQVLVLTLARLAPRFCHRIDFIAPERPCLPRLRPLLAADTFNGETLAALARLVWPDGLFAASAAEEADVVVGVGGVNGDIAAGIDEDGAAVVVVDGAVTIERADAIFAALAAAALACAQIAKRLYPEIVKADLEPIVRFGAGPLGGPLDPLAKIVLKRPVIAGVGAVGCALLYALIAAGASGTVLLLDPDIVKDSNLMRYVLFDERHLEKTKIRAAEEIIAASGLDLRVESAQTVIQSFLKRHPDERDRLELVVSAVDTYETRREIAGELPREVINAGTSPRDFTVSRHGFGDGYACLACLYPARKHDVELDAVIARELGLEKAEVAELRRTKKPLTAAQLARVALARGLAEDTYAAYIGEPLDSFYNKEFCAKVPVQTVRGEAIAPLAFGSALAGFLLGHALAFPEAGEYRHFRIDVFNGLGTPQRRTPRAKPDCPICGRAAYRSVYATRWHPQAA